MNLREDLAVRFAAFAILYLIARVQENGVACGEGILFPMDIDGMEQRVTVTSSSAMHTSDDAAAKGTIALVKKHSEPISYPEKQVCNKVHSTDVG